MEFKGRRRQWIKPRTCKYFIAVPILILHKKVQMLLLDCDAKGKRGELLQLFLLELLKYDAHFSHLCNKDNDFIPPIYVIYSVAYVVVANVVGWIYMVDVATTVRCIGESHWEYFKCFPIPMFKFVPEKYLLGSSQHTFRHAFTRHSAPHNFNEIRVHFQRV